MESSPVIEVSHSFLWVLINFLYLIVDNFNGILQVTVSNLQGKNGLGGV
jgi:hypothetical protein